MHLSLYFNKPDTLNILFRACYGKQAHISLGSIDALFVAGLFTRLSHTNGSCDTVYKINVIERPKDEVLRFVSICSGSSYNFYGTNLTVGGTYLKLQSSKDRNGCDSTAHLDLTVLKLVVALLP